MLTELISSGRSFSGNERNCCFLNTGELRFADISAVSGLNFPDDARAVALTDWDHDGDLDVWLANRSAPRLRLMRNETTSGHHFLAVHLEGKTCNRDAIGARVELIMRDSEEPRINDSKQGSSIIKTLRAGEGFLSQSSKWLHFGIGKADEIERLVIRWPDGQEEEFPGLELDCRYEIVQGSRQATLVHPRSVTPSLTPAEVRIHPAGEQGGTFLSERVLLPRLFYRTFEQQTRPLVDQAGDMVLVNFWASWCRPCLEELALFSASSSALRDAGVDVLALSVDALDAQASSGLQDAQALLERLEFPFRVGAATADTLDALQMINDHLYYWHRPFPVPTSILIDEQGRLATIYRGPVEVDQLLADVAKLRRKSGVSATTGQWHRRPLLNLTSLIRRLVKQDLLADHGVRYANRLHPIVSQEPGFPPVLLRIGQQLLAEKRSKRATAQFRKLVKLDPDFVDGHFNLALALTAQNQWNQAAVCFGRALELTDRTEEPQRARIHGQLGKVFLHLGEIGNAALHFEEALTNDPEFVMAHVGLGDVAVIQRNWSEALAHYETARKRAPQRAEIHYRLGNCSRKVQGMEAEAQRSYERALECDPNHVLAHNNFAMLLANTENATSEDLDRATQLAEKAAGLSEYQQADILDTLATVHARAGRFAEAIRWQTEASRLAVEEQRDAYDARLELYRAGKFE